jgi:hypothetical protein
MSIISLYSCKENKKQEDYDVVSSLDCYLDNSKIKEYENCLLKKQDRIIIYDTNNKKYPHIDDFHFINKDDIEFDSECQYDCGHISSYEDVYDTTYIIKRVCRINCKNK